MPGRFVHTHDNKTSKTYAPSFFEEGFLPGRHEQVLELVEGIRGKLAPADHYKLYEAGYFARGPILEIGRLHALSTILLRMGVADAGHDHELVSVEYEDRYLPAAKRNLDKFGLLDNVSLLQGDSSVIVRELPGGFDTIFVDGSHKYDGVCRDLDALDGKVVVGGVVMFHDYYHFANDSGAMGVRQAVDERSADLGLEFRGRSGGIAVFEKVS